MSKNVKDELYKNGLYINQVRDLFLWHFDSDKEAAQYFGVCEKTVKNWHRNRNYPMPVIRLIIVKHRGYLPPTEEWRGFRIRGDMLYTPSGRALSAYDLKELDIRVSLDEHVVKFSRKSY
ncbi:S-adenosylhomocysteine hydrolase [Vibrio nigripulchritudo SOn1]|uniref:S-adenosylhomocysteine hydrolase n=1 Tax=Vibrio nigripulchritudo SOn1 TaxID=1238450 RepID=A0AAV2VW85_9VIBR|nr:DUF3653 domain-containing protein [Vibrio nigripulchritudo]CCO48894.1 S-adenosylhomocysteine hydrolase [Vibrio nigripulchritudo SOn1]